MVVWFYVCGGMIVVMPEYLLGAPTYLYESLVCSLRWSVLGGLGCDSPVGLRRCLRLLHVNLSYKFPHHWEFLCDSVRMMKSVYHTGRQRWCIPIKSVICFMGFMSAASKSSKTVTVSIGKTSGDA